MYASDFIYNGELLSDYGFTICEFDSSSSLNTYDAGVPISFRTVSRKKGRTYSLIDLRYDNALEITFDICKDPCYTNQKDFEISDTDFLLISRWLLQEEYCDLQFINDKHSIPRHYNGIINLSKLTVDDNLMGLRVTVVTDKPYAYGDPIIYQNTLTSESSWEVPDNSPLTGIITPSLTITCNAAGTLLLTNDLTDSHMQIDNCTTGEIITVDGDNLIITSNVPTHEIWNDFNYEFLKIGNTKNNFINTLSSSLNCDVIIKYSPILRDAP